MTQAEIDKEFKKLEKEFDETIALYGALVDINGQEWVRKEINKFLKEHEAKFDALVEEEEKLNERKIKKIKP